MRKEGLETLTFTGHSKGKRETVIYRICLREWLAEQGVGRIVTKTFHWSDKISEVLERHDHPDFE